MNTKVKSFFDRRISKEVNMSATQTVELVKKLSNGKPLTEKTAGELLDYIAHQNGNLATKQDIENVENKIENKIESVEKEINWLKWSVGVGFAIFTVFLSSVLTVMVYLHSNTGKRIDKIEIDVREVRTEMQEVRKEMQEVRKELTELKKLITERIGRK